jgi:phytoene desaturase
MTMPGRSLIIIGAGLAGLSTGCYAQMNGYRSHIYEHHTLPGGVCTAWKRNGYTIDGCIHWLMSCKPGTDFRRIYDELGTFEDNRLMTVRHFASFRDEATGRCLDVTADLDRLAADMKAISPADSRVIDELIDGARAFRDFDSGIPTPPELAGRFAGLKQFWGMRRYMLRFVRYNVPVVKFTERFKDPFLRQSITNLFVPQMPTSFLFVILGQLAGEQLGLVEGGSLNFSRAIAQRYESLGGAITYGATVEEILTEPDPAAPGQDRAVGVRLADGTEVRGDVVISAADGFSTIFKMLGGRYVDQKTRDRFDKWPLFPGLLMVSLGVARQFPGELPSQQISLKQPIMVGGKPQSGFMLRIFNYDATLAPHGKTVLQVMVESDFDYWNDLQQNDRQRYEAEKAQVAHDVIERLEGHYPGVAAQVEMTDVATPYTFWRYSLNRRGSYEGWLMSGEAIMTFIPKTLPGLRNFYMAGQWVEPGGGIPPALYSGRNLVRTLCHADGQPFAATTP